MSSQSKKSKRKNGLEPITKISISGYKSIVQKQSVEVRPLTILAGANSSGKSSIVQPLLLLKQTLESSYDPGPLLLNGPNVKFTSVDQMFSKTGEKGSTNSFSVELHVNDGNLKLSFTKSKIERLELSEMSVNIGKSELILRP
ncbi:MAG: AAA family ATPase, partial [Blastocatellia bacterium]|nr:AAA family ATPase [Blastocatellia bacterium]